MPRIFRSNLYIFKAAIFWEFIMKKLILAAFATTVLATGASA